MYYPQREKEFYELINEKKKEIESLEISKNEKSKLYELVEETIQRFEENKKNDLKGLSVRLGKALGKMNYEFKKIYYIAKKAKGEMSRLEKIVKKIRTFIILKKNPYINN